MKHLFRKQSAPQEDYSSVATVDLITMLHNCYQCLAEVGGESSKAADREARKITNVVRELQGRSLGDDEETMRAICDSEDVVESLISCLSSALADLNNQRSSTDALQCILSVLVECLPTDRWANYSAHSKSVCQRVVRLLPGTEMLVSLLSPEMPFWVRHHTVTLIVRLVQGDSHGFTSLLMASTAVLTPLVQLLRSTETELALRDTALTVIRLITNPDVWRLYHGGTDHERLELGTVHRVLAFEGCLEDLVRVVREEGGLQAGGSSSRPMSCLWQMSGGSSDRVPNAGRGVGGSLDIVRECLVCVRQLLVSGGLEILKYFDANDLVVHLSFTASFEMAQKSFFEPEENRELSTAQGHMVQLPPFIRRLLPRNDLSSTQGDALQPMESILMETIAIVLHCALYRRQHCEDKLARLVQQLATPYAGQMSILDSIAQWLHSYAMFLHASATTARSVGVVLHPMGCLFVESCLAVVGLFLTHANTGAYMQTWMLEWQQRGDAKKRHADAIASTLFGHDLGGGGGAQCWLTAMFAIVVSSALGDACGGVRMRAIEVANALMTPQSALLSGLESVLQLATTIDTVSPLGMAFICEVLALLASSRATVGDCFNGVALELMCKFLIMAKASGTHPSVIFCICASVMLLQDFGGDGETTPIRACIDTLVAHLVQHCTTWCDEVQGAIILLAVYVECHTTSDHSGSTIQQLQSLTLPAAQTECKNVVDVLMLGCDDDTMVHAATFDDALAKWAVSSVVAAKVFPPSALPSQILVDPNDLADTLTLAAESGTIQRAPMSGVFDSVSSLLRLPSMQFTWSYVVRELMLGGTGSSRRDSIASTLRGAYDDARDTAKKRDLDARTESIKHSHVQKMGTMVEEVAVLSARVQALEADIHDKNKQLQDADERERRAAQKLDAHNARVARNVDFWTQTLTLM